MTEQKLQTELKRLYKPVPNGISEQIGQLLHTFAELHWDEPFGPFITVLTLQQIRLTLKEADLAKAELSKVDLRMIKNLFERYESLGF